MCLLVDITNIYFYVPVGKPESQRYRLFLKCVNFAQRRHLSMQFVETGCACVVVSVGLAREANPRCLLGLVGEVKGEFVIAPC